MQMSIDNPSKLVSLEDSLKRLNLSPKIVNALVYAHNSLGLSALESDNYKIAKNHFSSAIELSDIDSVSLYNYHLVEGHILFQTGKKTKIWDSIQQYNIASRFRPSLGEPYYYIGNSYSAIDDKDFDLIIESYNLALGLNLKDQLKKETIEALNKARERNRRLKAFWK